MHSAQRRVATTNLPQYATPIVGRERELAELAALLEREQVVTIAGTGGIGKTRVAVEAAAVTPFAAAGAVWFANLAPIADPLLLPTVVAGAIGLELAPSMDVHAALVAALRGESGLVVLDNCEHVLDQAAGVVEALIAQAPQLRILCTSREPLGIERESLYRLGVLEADAAFALFVVHAREADPTFAATGRNADLVRDICRRLDGIALAVELAAASVRLMPLGQLRARLEGRFRLVARRRAAPLARHETIEALIDWSYDLLAPEQRIAFARLGVFSGSFSDEAAIAVAGDPECDVAPVLPLLAQKSMLAVDSQRPPRYRMLESIRHYALVHLQERGEEQACRDAHAAYFLQRSAQAADAFGTGSQEQWLARYAGDLDNFRAALDWCVANDVPRAAAIAANLAWFWEYVNLAAEGMRRTEAILAAFEQPSEAPALPLLVAVARTALAARVYRRSLESAVRALALAERVDDAANAAYARRLAGRSRYLLGIESDVSLSDLRKALHYIRAHDKPFDTAQVLRDYASALAQTDPEEGRRLLLEALSLAGSLDWPRLTTHIEINVAEREFRSGNVEQAVERASDVVSRMRSRRSPVQLGHALTNLTTYLSVAERYDEALEAGREAIAIGRAHDMDDYISLTVQALALVRSVRGDAQCAARLLGFVDAFYDRYSSTREQTEVILQRRLLQSLRTQLDPAALERDIAEGRSLERDAAIALALP